MLTIPKYFNTVSRHGARDNYCKSSPKVLQENIEKMKMFDPELARKAQIAYDNKAISKSISFHELNQRSKYLYIRSIISFAHSFGQVISGRTFREQMTAELSFSSLLWLY